MTAETAKGGIEMASKLNVEALVRKQLGKETGDAVLAKIDKMVAEKKSAAEIQRVIMADIAIQIEKAVVATVIAKIGPITPIKVTPIQAAVKTTIGPIVVTPKVNAGIQLRTAPYTKGTK
jgi:hypothetical protein